MHDNMIHIKGFIVLQNSVNFPVIGSPKLLPQSESAGKSPKVVDIGEKSSKMGEKSPRIGDISEKSPRLGEFHGPSQAEDASIFSFLANFINLQPGQTKERSRWAAEIAR